MKQQVKVAEIGNVIQWLDREGRCQTGNVLNIYERAVCVDLTYSRNYDPLEMHDRTVVSHKKYKVIG